MRGVACREMGKEVRRKGGKGEAEGNREDGRKEKGTKRERGKGESREGEKEKIAGKQGKGEEEK